MTQQTECQCTKCEAKRIAALMPRSVNADGSDYVPPPAGGSWTPQAGDRMAWSGAGPWTVVAVDGDEAWCRSDSGRSAVSRLSALTPWEPPPSTERVPWHEAKGRQVPDGRAITAVGWRGSQKGPWIEVQGGADWADADGTVEVLRRPVGAAGDPGDQVEVQTFTACDHTDTKVNGAGLTECVDCGAVAIGGTDG